MPIRDDEEIERRRDGSGRKSLQPFASSSLAHPIYIDAAKESARSSIKVLSVTKSTDLDPTEGPLLKNQRANKSSDASADAYAEKCKERQDAEKKQQAKVSLFHLLRLPISHTPLTSYCEGEAREQPLIDETALRCADCRGKEGSCAKD